MLKNLMLPSVLDERDILKNEIISCKDEIKLTQLIKKYDEINNEIKKIKNKELNICIKLASIFYYVRIQKKY